MIHPFLIGDRIYLRPLDRADAPLCVTWFNDRDVTRYLAKTRPVTLQQEEEYIEKVSQGDQDLVLGMVIKEPEQFVGVTGLHRIDPKNRHASFGITIGAKEAWGKGAGTEAARLIVQHAFDTLNLNRVWLHVHERNQAGLRAYQKAGFRREGVLRQDSFGEGRYWDTIVMGVLRDEWVREGRATETLPGLSAREPTN
jgi:RimJ/RimL family protein N-acetyltransferase